MSGRIRKTEIEEQLAQAREALVHDPADGTGAAGEMEAQREAVQVLQRAQGGTTAQALLDGPVECPAQLVEDAGQPLQADIADEQGHRGSQSRRCGGELIDGTGEEERDAGVDEGREGQEADGKAEPQAEAGLVTWPDQGEKAEEGLAVEGRRAGGAGKRVEIAGHDAREVGPGVAGGIKAKMCDVAG